MIITELQVEYLHNNESKVNVISDPISMIKEIYIIKKEIEGIKK